LPKDFHAPADDIALMLKKIEARDQGFYNIVDDTKAVEDVLNFAKEVNGKYTDIVVLGIGGSSLGTLCLQQSLQHLYQNQLHVKTSRLYVLDNIDPVLIREVEDVITLESTLFIVVTKSGGTPEILSQYFYFRDICDKKKLNIADHFVFVTDPEKGLLRKIGKRDGIRMFDVPPNVGGRFSVLTAVGLLPAALVGIDVQSLLDGARAMRDQFMNTNFAQNLPYQLAKIQHYFGENSKPIHVLIPYSQKLIRFADWYRQLLAESIGKAKNDAGEVVNIGLTPVNALGVTDQHSQSQLYNEGPNDKFFIFINVQDHGKPLVIPNLEPDEDDASYLNGVDFGTLLATEMNGTIDALMHNERPSVTLTIPKVDAASLGGLFMLFEASIAFLGEMYGINAYDQPGVELSKQLTKKLLEKK
jgi:glucose-6-phosphate isomerase